MRVVIAIADGVRPKGEHGRDDRRSTNRQHGLLYTLNAGLLMR
jgi:hypothetical protein